MTLKAKKYKDKKCKFHNNNKAKKKTQDNKIDTDHETYTQN